jgi:hypothetical protein
VARFVSAETMGGWVKPVGLTVMSVVAIDNIVAYSILLVGRSNVDQHKSVVEIRLLSTFGSNSIRRQRAFVRSGCVVVGFCTRHLSDFRGEHCHINC